MRYFHQYLYGSNFLVRTDHASLTWPLNFRNPEGQVARWIEKLQQYSFVIKHGIGTKHSNADALSRRPCILENCRNCEIADERERNSIIVQTARTKPLDYDNWSKPWSNEMLRTEQFTDTHLKTIISWKQSKHRPEWNDISCFGSKVKRLCQQWDMLYLFDGILYRKFIDYKDEETWQLVVPDSMKKIVLQQVHGHIATGHFGVKKIIARVQQRFYWVGFRKDVSNWCKSCDLCSSRKGPSVKPKGPMKIYGSGEPMQRIAIDILGKLPVTESGKQYILVVMDYFTKWVEAYALSDQLATTAAKVLVDQFFSRFGVPIELHSDQGRNFESAVFSEVCKLLRIKKTRTTPLHPASDGMVERFNATLETQLSMFVSKHQRDWDTHLPMLLLAYRSAVHESTGFSFQN